MAAVNVYEAKTHFSRLLRRVRGGEEIVIAAAGRPVARLVPIGSDTGPRVLGGDEGEVWIAEDFNAPLPDAIVAAFYGAGAETTRPKARSGRRARPRARTGGRR
jgi:prevent-host-death family protein